MDGLLSEAYFLDRTNMVKGHARASLAPSWVEAFSFFRISRRLAKAALRLEDALESKEKDESKHLKSLF